MLPGKKKRDELISSGRTYKLASLILTSLTWLRPYFSRLDLVKPKKAKHHWEESSLEKLK